MQRKIYNNEGKFMKKKLDQALSVLPDVVKNFTDNFKNSFDEKGQDAIDDASGIVATTLKLLLQSVTDKYFDEKSKEKLDNYGYNGYLQAGINQAIESIEVVYLEDFDIGKEKMEVLVLGLKEMDKQLTSENIFLSFRPKYHPIVVEVKRVFENFLKESDFTSVLVKQFIKHFNENIENRIKIVFSKDYDKHMEEIEAYLLEENETKLLFDMYNLKRIGFADDENLNYQTTYGSWQDIETLNTLSNYDEYEKEEYEEIEDSLVDVEELIEEYYNSFDEENYLQSILFIVADFGKGKSVFLKQFASKLAKNYMDTNEGYIPIYFNLRDYGNYKNDVKLGVIGDFLETKYQLNLDEVNNKKKKYYFLIDSLDESGELTQNKISAVIDSIEKIQFIDKTKCITNKIVITTRPIDDGLKQQMGKYQAFTKIVEDKEIPQYISIFGFKKEQFNDWLISEFKKFDFKALEKNDFLGDIIKSIKKDKDFDIYHKLHSSKTLSRSELQRPIFGYMIYRLLLSNIDFMKIGKIGVYLSFLNLLTKEAKYIDAVTVDLEEEYASRNILHATAALWMYQKHRYNTSTIKKEDILKVFNAKDEKSLDIEFLSHSYFGEDNSILHFQHQSFAEILLAEYYLKIFIQTAVDSDSKIDEARYRLFIGKPTEQTMLFLRELLLLLKGTISEEITPDIEQKRELLLPLFSSMAIKENNMLFSNDIFYKWYDSYQTKEERIKNWYFTEDKLDKVVEVSKDILDAPSNLMLEQADTKSALFDDEILLLKTNTFENTFVDIDKWLALMVGNELYIKKGKYFNAKVKDGSLFFSMMNNWHFTNQEANPSWAGEYFQGINLKNNDKKIALNVKYLADIDFTGSYLENIEFIHMFLTNVVFTDSFLSNVIFSNTIFDHVLFHNIDIDAVSDIFHAVIFDASIAGNKIPYKFVHLLFHYSIKHGHRMVKPKGRKVFLENTNYGKKRFDFDFETWKGLFILGLKKDLFSIKEIKSWFTYKNTTERKIFEDLIDTLESEI